MGEREMRERRERDEGEERERDEGEEREREVRKRNAQLTCSADSKCIASTGLTFRSVARWSALSSLGEIIGGGE